jgi:hypothetical protein
MGDDIFQPSGQIAVHPFLTQLLGESEQEMIHMSLGQTCGEIRDCT